jgi:DNA-binding CsgD family transcriptional regulator
MSQVAATAAVFLAEVAAVSDDPMAMVDAIADAEESCPGDPEITGSVWGARGLARLFRGDRAGAREPLRRSFEILTRLPNPGPAVYLGFWPLLLAVNDYGSAEAASAAAREAGVTVNRANRGLLGYADAVRIGPTDLQGAASLAAQATADLAAYPVWADLARLLVAPWARRDGWGDWRGWLESAAATFDRHGLVELAGEARDSGRAGTGLAATLGITLRETEVLRLVGAGLSNKEIAAQLVLSSRTVEKHVEGLFRKTGTRSRTELLASPVGREVAYGAT